MNKLAEATIYGHSKTGRKFYFSEKKEWEENSRCGDTLNNDVYDTIYEIGLIEETEGIWSKQNNKTKTEEIVKNLNEAGFEYNQKFESFMR